MISPLSYLWILLGWVSLSLGFAGIFLPILPTTPFVLLAAFCFSKGSKKWHTWLRTHKQFGPLIQDWEKNGSIHPRAKTTATLLITILFSFSIIVLKIPIWAKSLLIFIAISVLCFIWSRPSSSHSAIK